MEPSSLWYKMRLRQSSLMGHKHQINSYNKHRSICRWSRNNDFFGSSFNVRLGLFQSSEDSSRLNNIFSPNRCPWNILGVSLTEDTDFMTIDNKFTICFFNFSLEASVC